MQSGILAIDKPEGPSSARVVERVKRILGARKVGHLGTLDPFASGLLPMGVNEGTKIAQFLLAAEKSYAGAIALGIETDTQDRTGKVLRVRPPTPLTPAVLEELRAAFTGNLRQTPPMYSALKRAGVRLYELARRGEWVAREVREVTVKSLRLWQIGESEIGFEVACSKGTYVRTLAANMGEYLGCGAHLKFLRRLSCGSLTLDQAVSLEELEQCRAKGAVPLIPLNEALRHLPAFAVAPAALERVRKGRQEALAGLPPADHQRIARLLDERGELAALIEWRAGEGRPGWRLMRVFGANEPP
ncbi:MAG TPA: tRNA pseudouridine(55) synthase TruB [Candidatus Acidoferrales bacterium]|nr:tRNA pseudouridine(55) synthase TruB [Candidatus Acidoferrales bacterium]